MELLVEKYRSLIKGMISCFDRCIITGTLPGICYPEGMTSYLYKHNIRIFDYKKFAMSLRDEIIDNAKQIAQDEGVEIEYIKKKNFRQEDRIKQILKKRGDHPGLVHVFSVLETCTAYEPYFDKKTNRSYMRYDNGKCLHYYFYLIDEFLGLCYIHVSTWCPFRITVYFNGHSVLAALLKEHNISFTLIDNAFVSIDDFQKAQSLSDSLNVELLHKRLDYLAEKFCPVIKQFDAQYHWSISQVEYATDISFKKQSDLKPIYETLIKTAIHSIKPEHIATFLGKKLNGNYQGEMGNSFETRIMGTRIKHTMGPVAIKMYDKFSLVLRIETTVNDITFFKHYRKVVQRNGKSELKFASMRKGIYNLSPLSKLLRNANFRYLDFISTIDDDRTSGIKRLYTLSKTVKIKNRPYKGFNFFAEDDLSLLLAIQRGEFNISGFQNKYLRPLLPNKSSSYISRLLKRLLSHGLIKKVKHTYKYYITSFGRLIIALALKLRELFIIPQLSLSFPSFQ